jgi:hypothetical protein
MNLKEKCPRGNKSGKKQLLEDRGRGFVARWRTQKWQHPRNMTINNNKARRSKLQQVIATNLKWALCTHAEVLWVITLHSLIEGYYLWGIHSFHFQSTSLLPCLSATLVPPPAGLNDVIGQGTITWINSMKTSNFIQCKTSIGAKPPQKGN